MTNADLDALVVAQNAMEKLWPRLGHLGSVDIVMLCKLRHKLEREDGFVPEPVVIRWLEDLLEKVK